jgi:hypothetical protein
MTTCDAPSLLSAARKSAKSRVIGEPSGDPEPVGGVEEGHRGRHALLGRCVARVLHLLLDEIVLMRTILIQAAPVEPPRPGAL